MDEREFNSLRTEIFKGVEEMKKHQVYLSVNYAKSAVLTSDLDSALYYIFDRFSARIALKEILDDYLNRLGSKGLIDELNNYLENM